ncbi:hypothetical protein M2152_000289 [Microbacteriaceae bacterium SG_E_30_P1]|uniref:DUF4153 domain-containing protein n=1 Tax=Antiquaquibacter oligotrophicus TaxID=2880260 RepID=A0ABT6KLU9_9MICO|nr:permease prefix domain 1-containing protein [Antiquaquibacter oligotrophicus]MDH6180107.1 hypothetical protein [Antiquaquibacter oligotrophicus]UDF14142.1 permease prefix domain 1-containing protein [Antiquaquibacter oligotrophicus]
MKTDTLDEQIAAWRKALLRSDAVTDADADELEEHLRDQASDLAAAGLTDDEAFLIAVRRIGQVDAVTAEYAREHGDRLWKQLVTPGRSSDGSTRQSVGVMIAFAAVAIVVLHSARLLAMGGYSDTRFLDEPIQPWFGRSFSLFVLPVLGAYFAYTRRSSLARVGVIAAATIALGIAINVFPYSSDSSSEVIVSLHLPFLLWFLMGALYVRDLRSSSERMDFVRFTGEWVIYVLLIVIGGGVLLSLTSLVLAPIMPDAIGEIFVWVMPAGGAAAVIVAAWLVEAKKSMIENLAPVLTAIFTPLFAALLLVAAVGYAALRPEDFNRELLAGFDVLMIIVVALVVYGISARPSDRAPGVMDVLRLVAVVAAILLDVIVLILMFARVGDLGLTPNRVAALGLNIVLLVNLIGTAWFSARHLGGAPIVHLERWQTGYLPVFAGWLALVVVALPPAFLFG